MPIWFIIFINDFFIIIILFFQDIGTSKCVPDVCYLKTSVDCPNDCDQSHGQCTYTSCVRLNDEPVLFYFLNDYSKLKNFVY
jgi:hypothetical protein